MHGILFSTYVHVTVWKKWFGKVTLDPSIKTLPSVYVSMKIRRDLQGMFIGGGKLASDNACTKNSPRIDSCGIFLGRSQTGVCSFFSNYMGFTCILHHLERHFQNNSLNRLEYQFVLNHSGTHLIFPWHSFEHQARFWQIIVQLVASNIAKLLSQLIANTTLNFFEFAWKSLFFSAFSPGHGAGATHSWDLATAIGRIEVAAVLFLVNKKSTLPEDMPESVSSQHHYHYQQFCLLT